MRVFAIAIILVLTSLAGILILAMQAAEKMPRIGLLNPGSPASHGAPYEAFKQGLRERGYMFDFALNPAGKPGGGTTPKAGRLRPGTVG